MKNPFYNKDFQFLLPITTAISLLVGSCQTNSKEISGIKKNKSLAEKGYTDFNGAMEYEFNLIKNPSTGRIPDGSFTGELEQARAIVESQQPNNGVAISTYSFQGPENLGGRTRTIAYDVRYDGTTNRIILAGGVSGGVFKSTDNGATWIRTSPTGEHFSCTSLAQDTRAGFRDTWYYGVGEPTGNSASGSGAGYSGNGVYKSTDNGSSWSRLTTSNTTAIESFTVAQDYTNKVIVDPINGNIYVACPATIRRSIDGGTTWTTVLSGSLSFSSQFTDIVVTSTGRLYASFGGTNSSTVDGVWVSPAGITSGDAGTWTRIAGAGAGGSPTGWDAEGAYGRVVLAIAPSAENLVYALYWNGTTYTCGAPASEGKLFRYDDIGSTWTDLSATMPDEAGCLSGNDPFACQTGYDLVVAVKPDASSTVFIGGTNSYRSTDAGLTWTRIGGYASSASYSLYLSSHPDVHAFTFQPGSPSIMLCGNDGGIQRTTLNTATPVVWTQINTGYRTYQYYYVDVDPRLGNTKVLGGAQDNGSTRNIGGSGTDFESVFGGDGVSVGLTVLISGTQYEYVGSQLGSIVRRASTLGSGSGTTITPTGESGTGLFVTLFKVDPDNTETLYYANDNIIYRTTSASTVSSGTWTSMSGIATAVGAANDVTAMATTRGVYSAATSSLFFGTSNGKLFRLDDPTGVAAATTPVEITGGTFPAGYVSSVAVNPRNDDTVLVTFSNYGVTSVFWTGTANTAVPIWTAVEGALTLPSYRSSAIAITASGVEYFVGTSVGLYTSTGLPGVVTWTQEGSTEIGNAVVSSLALRKEDNKLLVGTHGHAMWSTILTLPVVPITLTEFKGTMQNGHALLQWSTSMEVNSKHFELEKSFDGTVFRKIATLPAARFSITVKNYSFTDFEKLYEKNYYRLRSVDLDEKNNLSNTLLITPAGIEQEMVVLSNPFKNNITIRFVRATEAPGIVWMTDISGRLITSQKFAKGTQQVEFIPPGKLSKGLYQIHAQINGNKFTKQVLKE